MDTRNIEFERQVLGAAILDVEARTVAIAELNPEDFYDPAHEAVFRVILARYNSGEATDPGLIADDLRRGTLTLDGDPLSFVWGLSEDAATLAGLPQRITRLRALADARAMSAASAQFATKVEQAGGNAHHLAEARHWLDEQMRIVEAASLRQTPWESVEDVIPRVLEGEQSVPTIQSGLVDLDRAVLGGFRPGQLVVIAGRPGRGKTTLATNIATHSAFERGRPGLFITMEMRNDEMVERIVASMTRIDLSRFKRTSTGNRLLDDQDLDKIEEARERIARSSTFKLVEQNMRTIAAVAAVIQEAKTKLGIEWVVVDYVQLLVEDPKSEMEDISHASRILKALALRLGLVIISVAQLNRAVDSRASRVPQLSDLRGSGQLEQDADIVAMIDRPELVNAQERPGEADIHIVKHRQGPTAVVPVVFSGNYNLFQNLAPDFTYARSEQ